MIARPPAPPNANTWVAAKLASTSRTAKGRGMWGPPSLRTA
jgi:hypothetical protein